MNFVTFHVSMGGDEPVHPNQTLQTDEYMEMLDMMFSSASIFHPGATKIILSDLHTDFLNLEKAVVVKRIKLSRSELMLERARSQLHYIRNYDFSEPVVFLDSDILINGPLYGLFKHDFDIALTWREDIEMPINGGMLVINNQYPDRCVGFLKDFIELFEHNYIGQGAWYGDQLALKEYLGLELDQIRKKFIVNISGCRVMLLPCDIYNYSPQNNYAAIAYGLSERKVLHFKGKRKRLMRTVWEGWVNPRGVFNADMNANAMRQRRLVRSRAMQYLDQNSGHE